MIRKKSSLFSAKKAFVPKALFSQAFSQKAFVLSIDALFAALLLSIVLASFTVSMNKAPVSENLSASASDAFRAMEGSGFLQNEFDEYSLNTAVQDIHAKAISYLPANRGLFVSVKQYSLDSDACRTDGNFESCFPQSSLLEASFGDSIPAGKDVVRGRSIVVKKQSPPDCNVDYFSFAGIPEKSVWNEKPVIALFEDFTAFFKEQEPKDKAGKDQQASNFTAFFEEQEPDDIGLVFDVNTSPAGELMCDSNLTVNMGIGMTEFVRRPIDTMLIIDRSGSMGECIIADGNLITSGSGSLGGGTYTGGNYNNWVNVASFTISDLNAFNALLTWTGFAGSGWRSVKFYLLAPSGTRYGFYGGLPSNGCYDTSYPNMIHIAIPSSVSQNGLWRAYAWNDNPAVPYAVTVKSISEVQSLLDVAKEAAITFLYDANWTANDYIGLVSFNSIAVRDQNLTTDRPLVESKITALVDGGNTAIGEAIYNANGELRLPPIGHGRSNSLKFEVLLSDGQTNSGRASSGAATEARDNNIVIFTVGIGPDVDEAELQSIAAITDGNYYYAGDANVLNYIYELIAKRIQEISATASQIIIPIPPGSIIIDPGSGTIVDSNIVYTGSELSPGIFWYGSYTINFPCDNNQNCSSGTIVIPGETAMLTYTGTDGEDYEVYFDVNSIITLLSRDLRLDIFNGELLGKDNLFVDVNVANVGDLNTPGTNIRFRLDDANGELLDTISVPALCGGNDVNCSDDFIVFRDINIKREGTIYATVNEDKDIKECPLGNTDAMDCYGGPSTQFFAIDYYVWVK